MGLLGVNEFRLNENGVFEEISKQRAESEHVLFLENLITKKINSSTKENEKQIFLIGNNGLEKPDLSLLVSICFSLSITDEEIEDRPFKFHIGAGQRDVTLDFRDMLNLNSKSENMLMSMLIKELSIPPIEITPIILSRANPSEFVNSIILLSNNPIQGTFAKFYLTSHPDYGKALNLFN